MLQLKEFVLQKKVNLLFAVNRVTEAIISAVTDLQGRKTSLKDKRRRVQKMVAKLEMLHFDDTM